MTNGIFRAVQQAIRNEGYRIAKESGDPDPRFWSEALAQATLSAINETHVIVTKAEHKRSKSNQ